MAFDLEEYRALGWSLVRLYGVVGEHCKCHDPHCPHAGKHPVQKGWQMGDTDLIRRSDNVGVRLGAASQIMAIDIDRKNGKDGFEACKAHGFDLPRTLKQSTPTGGVHYIVRAPFYDGNNPSCKKFVDDGLELLGNGAQIVVAPSTTPNGAYEWQNWGDEEIAPAPQWMIDLIAEKRANVFDNKRELDVALTLVSGRNLDRAIARAATFPPSLKGGGGVKLAGLFRCLVRGFCMPYEQADAIAQEHYNPRCEPPWDLSSRKDEKNWVHTLYNAPMSGEDIGARLLKVKLPRVTQGTMADNRGLSAIDGATALNIEEDIEERAAPRRALRVVAEGEVPTADGRPEIFISTQIAEMADDAIAALENDPTVFTKSGLLVRAAQGQLITLDTHALKEKLSACAVWFKFKPNKNDGGDWIHARPDTDTVNAVASRGAWPTLREIVGIADHPVMTPDGAIESAPGYSPASRFYLTDKAQGAAFNNTPTRDEARESIDLLYSYVSEFSFASPAHRASWLAALLTPIVRPAHAGVSPFFLFDANDAGAGKGMLVHVIATILTGEPMPLVTYGNDEDQLRKLVTAHLLSGVSMMAFDNIKRELGGAVLECVTTATTWADRKMHAHRILSLDARIAWMGTGNNVQFSTDMGRRILPIRLEKTLRPANHEFQHPDLIGEVRRTRASLISACCTIVRAYQTAGMPKQPTLSGDSSFMQWNRLVRDCLVFCGEPDVYESAKQMREENDVDAQLLQRVITGWRELEDGEGQGVIVSEAVRRIKSGGLNFLFDALGDISKDLDTAQIGRWLTRFKGKVVNGSSMITPKKHRSAAWQWAVKTHK